MPEPDTPFRYLAVGADGRRVRGTIAAAGEGAAFQKLRAQGLSPLRLTAGAAAGPQAGAPMLSERDCVEFVANLGQLLSAGADMRTALGVLGARASRRKLGAACRRLGGEIAGGAPLDRSFARISSQHGAFIGAMVAAGEASGDLAGGLSRAAEIIEARARLRGKLVSTLTYPAFVFASTVAAVLALLLFVIPSLAPLVRDSGGPPPTSLRLMLAASDALQGHMVLMQILLIMAGGLTALGWRSGQLARLTDRLLLAGPLQRTASAVVYGAFAVILGGMLSAGTPMSQALRLAVGSVRSPLGRRRLEPIVQQVRQGQPLSRALEQVRGFPEAIWSLAAVGEASGALGPMLARSGRLEEEAALARIATVGEVAGPALIVVLGGLVGLLMAGLLSGVSQLGQSALN